LFARTDPSAHGF
jgi:hypothetical protein